MTVIVSVKINDGIVLASDSAATFGTGQIYHHAEKIVNLVKGLPIGAMVTGAGGIGSESITTILKDLRKRLSGSDTNFKEWTLNREHYSMHEVASRVAEILQEKSTPEVSMQLRIAGYGSGRPLPELWDLVIREGQFHDLFCVRDEQGWGVNWDGDYEALNRLILGFPVDFGQVVKNLGVPDERTADVQKVAGELYNHMALPSMPIHDAIDLARYLVETTIGFMRFSVFRQPKTVGGPIEIAAITKHEGFRWIQRKHFYKRELNLSDPD
ncbi:hypothetical protein [Microvirga sp. M2]|uniref:hypothetical protein n=1 Tax=Microvirga sp. M2 TaxID=3073270 RepID=UPI0039C4856A